MRALTLIAGVAAAFLVAAAPARAEEALNKPPRGFKALFNARDLTNWQGLVELPTRNKLASDPAALKAAQEKADQQMREHWSVEDGILVFDGKGNSLQTARDYGDFELYVDWKILPKGDSGIYLRGNPQVQIWDPSVQAAGGIGSGGLYNNKNNPSKPLLLADKPVGEWNRFYIKMVGDRVTVKLNDKIVVDNTPLENYWEPGKPLPEMGPIELQNHGNRLEFRNIYVRELPRQKQTGAAQPTPPVTLRLENAKFADAIRLICASSTHQVVFVDPAGKLGDRRLALISLTNMPFEKALEKICIAAEARLERAPDGIYYISPRS